MLLKIKTLKQLLEPTANKLGRTFESWIENSVDENMRFSFFMKEYSKKVNVEKYPKMSFTNSLIYLSSDLESVEEYLKENYYIKNTNKYYKLFKKHLSKVVSSNQPVISQWRNNALITTNKEECLISPRSSFELYSKLKFKDISNLLKEVGLKPLYHLEDGELSTILNDEGYEKWLFSLKYHGRNPINMGFPSPFAPEYVDIKRIYDLYFDYIIGKWIRSNIDENSDLAKKNKSRYGSHTFTKPMIEHIIFKNRKEFKKWEDDPITEIIPGDGVYELVHDIPVVNTKEDLKLIIQHFNDFKEKIKRMVAKDCSKDLYTQPELDPYGKLRNEIRNKKVAK